MTRKVHIGFGLVLTALAGFVDAIGFIQLGGLYTSLVSGNIAQFSIALGHFEPWVALLPAILVAGFMVGAFAAGLITAATPDGWVTPTILGFETAAVASAWSLVTSGAPIAVGCVFLAVAMGAQNGALAHVKGFRAGTTFVTGALFSFSQNLALALTGRGEHYAWVSDGAVWLAFLIGAFLGTVVLAQLGIDAIGIAAIVTTMVCAASIVKTIVISGAWTRSRSKTAAKPASEEGLST